MTSRQLTAVALKVLAIYIIYSAVVCLPLYLRAYWDHVEDKIWGIIGITVMICISGVVAWTACKFARSLASDIRSAEHESIVTLIDKAQIENVLFRILGLYVFSTHLRPVVDNFFFIRMKIYNTLGEVPDLHKHRVSLIVDLVILAFAISFILKPSFWQEKFKTLDRTEKGLEANKASEATLEPAPSKDPASSRQG
jgi:hypothetical protein